MIPSCENIGDLLVLRASKSPDKDAFVFLVDAERESPLTYRELLRRCEHLAAHIQSLEGFRINERALLMLQPGLEYIVAFFGCVLAGAIPVPVYPPSIKSMDRLRHIAADSDAKYIVAERSFREKLVAADAQGGLTGWQRDQLLARTWIDESQLMGPGTEAPGASRAYERPYLEPDQTAFIQYTSGSTSLPKGVEVSHRNLLHNAELGVRSTNLTSECVVVSWLPLYHDMGLIGSIFMVLYGGSTAVLMSPIAFLKRPVRWLRALSNARPGPGGFVCGGGPDFGYDHCEKRIKDSELEGIDLSRWRVAFSGAEQVRANTLRRFAERFGRIGFRAEAFLPVYGLAEATLIVSATTPFKGPVVRRFDTDALHARRAQPKEDSADSTELVGSGHVLGQQELVLVDPESLAQVPEGHIGEICLAGASVARGYSNRELSRGVFALELAGFPGRKFLRTGDLGFLHEGQLFVQGRVKDLMIIRGKNYYPHDIEYDVAAVDANLREGRAAAFSVDVEDEEQLVIVQELAAPRIAKTDLERIVSRVNHCLAEQWSLRAHEILLVPSSSIPHTSSGKKQRSKVRELYLQGGLRVVFSSREASGQEIGT